MVLKKNIYKIIVLLLLSSSLAAQDLEQIKKAKPLTIAGGFSANTTLYSAWGMDSRQDPYFWQLTANINFNFYGIVNMPFSAYLSKKNTRYQQPSYKIYGISPRYKSVTLHLGYRNMSFSKYSLAGLTFFGAGIEYKPTNKWLSASAMYGRFFKAVEYGDSTKNEFMDPSYERWGGGLSVSASGQNKELTILVFKAFDKPSSIADPPSELGITPAENFIVGLAGKAQIIQRISLSAEYTLSAYTKDVRMPEKEFLHYTYLNNMGKIYTPRYSSSIYNALESSINYQGNTFATGINYTRIDPGYTSLGSTFIENDVENILLTMSKTFAENKINISGNIGQQRNNLIKDKQVENKRLVNSLSIAWALSKQLNINGNYSNYTSSSQPTLINFTDSVKYFQINKNTSVNISYSKTTETTLHSINVMLAQQVASSLNRSATQKLSTDNNMLNTNISYQVSFPLSKFAGTFSFQNSWFTTNLGTTKNFGPNIAISQELLKSKVKLLFSYNYCITQPIENKSNSTHTFRLNGDFQAFKHQTIRFQASFMQRNNASTTGHLSPKELQASLTYQYSF